MSNERATIQPLASAEKLGKKLTKELGDLKQQSTKIQQELNHPATFGSSGGLEQQLSKAYTELQRVANVTNNPDGTVASYSERSGHTADDAQRQYKKYHSLLLEVNGKRQELADVKNEIVGVRKSLEENQKRLNSLEDNRQKLLETEVKSPSWGLNQSQRRQEENLRQMEIARKEAKLEQKVGLGVIGVSVGLGVANVISLEMAIVGAIIGAIMYANSRSNEKNLDRREGFHQKMIEKSFEAESERVRNAPM